MTVEFMRKLPQRETRLYGQGGTKTLILHYITYSIWYIDVYRYLYTIYYIHGDSHG